MGEGGAAARSGGAGGKMALAGGRMASAGGRMVLAAHTESGCESGHLGAVCHRPPCFAHSPASGTPDGHVLGAGRQAWRSHATNPLRGPRAWFVVYLPITGDSGGQASRPAGIWLSCAPSPLVLVLSPAIRRRRGDPGRESVRATTGAQRRTTHSAHARAAHAAELPTADASTAAAGHHCMLLIVDGELS